MSEENLTQNNSGNGTSYLVIQALKSNFESQRDTALAQLSVFVNSSVGVADHANLINECSELVKQVTEAEECLRTIGTVFSSA